MKSRIVTIGTALAALALGAGLYALGAGTGAARAYQHLEPQWQPAAAQAEAAGFCTHLPIVSLETGGREVPGLPDGGAYTTTPDGEKTLRAAFALRDGGTGENRPEDTPTLASPAEIRYRGNSSRHFDKKSYAVHLVTEDGQENPQPLMGLPAHDEWVLNGPFLDRTLLRNYLCFNIAGEIMEYAPNVRYCELFLDGAYQGVYLLIENVSRGEGRIDIPKPEKNSAVTSYIVRWDRAQKGDQELDNYAYYTFRGDVSALDVRYPGKNQITPARLRYIEQDISRVERVIYSDALTDRRTGASRYLDYDSFAEYFVINEFFRNVDAGRFSTFFYKDARGKLKTCVWDFNNACDNYIDSPWDEAGFTMQNAPWFEALLQDERFVSLVVDKYRALRTGVLDDGYLIARIDETVAWLGEAVERNYSLWGYVFDLTGYNDLTYLTPAARNVTSYPQAVAQLKDFLTARGAWLDAHIDSLYQYCHPSKNAG